MTQNYIQRPTSNSGNNSVINNQNHNHANEAIRIINSNS